MVIFPESARTTALGQTLDPSPISTSPTTYASSLTKAVGWTFGHTPSKLLINLSPQFQVFSTLQNGHYVGGFPFDRLRIFLVSSQYIQRHSTNAQSNIRSRA
jgi:hypothetical protein